MTQLQEKFAQSAAKLIQKAQELGYGVTLGEAWRSPQQAEWNAQHGTGIVHSLHTERLAIDINLFKNGVFITDEQGHRELGAWWKTIDLDCRWGGDFKSNPDFNHYSMTPDGVRA